MIISSDTFFLSAEELKNECAIQVKWDEKHALNSEVPPAWEGHSDPVRKAELWSSYLQTLSAITARSQRGEREFSDGTEAFTGMLGRTVIMILKLNYLDTLEFSKVSGMLWTTPGDSCENLKMTSYIH